MFTLFDQTATASIGLFDGAPEAVWLAAADLRRNLLALSGKKDGFAIGCGTAGIRIELFAGEPESYRVMVGEDGVRILGGDALGAVFGIYAFATRVLGIEPTYRLTDRFPEMREYMTVVDTEFHSDPRPIRFRGWFLNDEDLLTEFKVSGGVRHFDYKFYQTVMHPDVLDMILETALRHEINLIIPSSFVDVDNPDEEKLAAAAVRRGMYITQHHVEPLGVSYFGARNYMEKHGCEGQVSFVSNRAVMEEIWEYYVRKWAKYGDRVIWQLGLRGRADEAVWKRDPNVPMTSEGRGAIITDAIRTQYKTVKRVLGHENFVSTSTLWLEGAELYGKGHLRMPENTMVIFSDIGFDQMWGEDFFSTKRLANIQYGVYYHIAFYARGPHLAEGCDPLKMTYCYRRAAEMNSLTYAIVNVSNVRPLHYAVSYNAALMADPKGTDYESFKKDFHLRNFGSAAHIVMALRDRYYLAKSRIPDHIFIKRSEKDNFYPHPYGELSFPHFTADDGELWSYGNKLLKGQPLLAYREELQTSEKEFAMLYRDACAAEERIPEAHRDYFRTFLKFQIGYMLQMTRWVLACHDIAESEGEERQAHGRRAVACLDRILEARKIEARGQWADWHRGEKKLNIPELRKLTAETAGI